MYGLGTVGYTYGTDNTGSFQDFTNSAGLSLIGSLMLKSTKFALWGHRWHLTIAIMSARLVGFDNNNDRVNLFTVL